MIQTKVSFLLVGKVLARHVMTENGTILLKERTILTERFIERLQQLKISHVYIVDEEDSSYSDREHYLSVKRTRQLRSMVYRELIQFADSKEMMNWFNNTAKQEEYYSTLRSIYYDISMNDDVNYLLVKMMQTDRQLFDKALNVTLISGIIGLEKQYSTRELRELCIGALLSDIGMTEIPKNVRTATCHFSNEEREIIQSHVMRGYELLKLKRDIPYRSSICVLQHHERYDGSGYPNGLLHDQIDEYAQIVALADVYYALISPRYHRNAFTKCEALEFLFAAGNRYFDIELVKTFFRGVSIYPVATEVVLNNGYIGIVTAVNKDLLHKPIVRVYEHNGERIYPPYEIDLKKTKNLYIVS